MAKFQKFDPKAHLHGLAEAAAQIAREQQAAELIAAGKMPSLDTVLQAVAETRKKFVPKILKAREETKK
jgi:hypothetical protein